MQELVVWLRGQLDEDERIAYEADDSIGKVNLDWSYQPDDQLGGKVLADGFYDLIPEVTAGVGAHVTEHDPRRVLREIDAKRRLLYQFEHRGNSVRATVVPSTGGVWDDLLRMLAVPYSHRSGYRAEWRP